VQRTVAAWPAGYQSPHRSERKHDGARLLFDDDSYCVTRINVIDARAADVDVLNFGAVPRPTAQLTALPNPTLKFRF
jgi:hypothetical protein